MLQKWGSKFVRAGAWCVSTAARPPPSTLLLSECCWSAPPTATGRHVGGLHGRTDTGGASRRRSMSQALFAKFSKEACRPLRAMSRRWADESALRIAGRISQATPRPGSGLIRAATQSARSVTSDAGGIGPKCSKIMSIWPGWRSRPARTSRNQRSTRGSRVSLRANSPCIGLSSSSLTHSKDTRKRGFELVLSGSSSTEGCPGKVNRRPPTTSSSTESPTVRRLTTRTSTPALMMLPP
mmetsp:Transcript_14510/g.37515  ORF Transcript_14510/g.37515 Transcript_14510/m.37515 type:complete len:239 (-) Transcript_14510:1141-1857(-)